MIDPQPNPVRGFFGAMLIGVGVLMMLLCGGCGAVFFIGFFASGLFSSNREDLTMAVLPIVLGGVPAAIGFGLFVGGRRLRKPQVAEPPPPQSPPDDYDRSVHP